MNAQQVIFKYNALEWMHQKVAQGERERASWLSKQVHKEHSTFGQMALAHAVAVTASDTSMECLKLAKVNAA